MTNRRPSRFWRHTIRDALLALGGEASLTKVYEWIEAHINLTARELSTSPHQGRPHYVHTVRGIASDMVDSGALERVERGCYRLPVDSN